MFTPKPHASASLTEGLKNAVYKLLLFRKTVPKTHEKVRNVCPMLVNVKKCMYFAHAHIKRNVLMDN